MAPHPFLPRAAARPLAAMLAAMPVVVVTGARQTGKTELVRNAPELDEYARADLDDLNQRTAAVSDPAAFVGRAPRMIIDEVQRAPDLLLAVKAAVDREGQRTKGRFVLTGSANLLVMRQVSDSLAGRAGYLALQPMTRRELHGLGETGLWSRPFELPFDEWHEALSADPPQRDDWRVLARRGGFPVPALHLDDAARATWLDGYVATYLERDLRAVSAVDALGDFRRAMRAFALRAGSPINHADVARELGLLARTLRRWLELLDVTYQVMSVPAYAVRRSVRLRKRPKYYWNDAALAMQVAGEGEPRGVHLETIVFNDLRSWAALDSRRPSVMYWRDEEQREVDFVVERDGQVLAIEVKAAQRVAAADYRHLLHFVSEYRRRCVGAVLLYDGDEVLRVADGVLAVPWWRIL